MKIKWLNKITRRGFVRICSFGLAAIMVLGGVAASGFVVADRYRDRLEITYEQNLNELSDHLNTIETTLSKGIYASTVSGASTLAMKLWNSASAAQVCLSNIPLSGGPLSNVNKFLSQVGDYSLAVADRLKNGEKTTDSDRLNLQTLAKYAHEINTAVDEMNTMLNNSGEWKKQIKSVIDNDERLASTQLSEGFSHLENSFSEFPTLLYDGPFSDHILQSEPLFIMGKPEISKALAKEKAMEMTGISTLTDKSPVNGKIPCYSFESGSLTVDITKNGGYCSYFLNSRGVANSRKSGDECAKIASKYVNSLGLGSFKESYFSIDEGVCTVNFAYTENETVFYTDLIKVGVATDTGEILSYNAQGFIMNHTERNFDEPKYSLDDAKNVLSDLLKMQTGRRAVIPLNTQKERLCYEFLCKGQNDEDILVYINANTLQEENILIVLKSDGGTLTV